MRRDRTWFGLTLLVAVMSVCAALTGCSSSSKKTPGEERAASAVTGLKETRAELVTGKAQVDRTLTALNAIRDGQGSLQTDFAAFNEEIKKTDDQATKIRTRAADMRARANQYQAKWREEMEQVDDPALLAASSARANKVRERYDGITAKANQVRGSYRPFMKQLKAVQTYLSNDLTPPGVESATAVFDKATADGKVVTQKIDALVAELDDVASALSPAPGASAGSSKK